MSSPRSRTANSMRNASISVLVQVAIIGLGFITRTIFISELGVSLLGINTLLTSLVAILAFADLGISSALMYSLYKPLRDRDSKSVAAIVQYAGRLFRWVALFVAVVGSALTPFVHLLTRLDEKIPYLEVYYLVLLANTAVSYLMLNRIVLIDADQKIYLTKTYSLVFNVLRSVAQITSLIYLESFLAFLVIQVMFTWLGNFVVYLRAGKMYPYIKSSSPLLNPEDRQSILASVRAMMIFRVGGLILGHSPSILISILVGTVALGYYSNYLLIVAAAVMITEVVFSSFTPSVGNLIASGDRSSSRRVFDEMVVLSTIVHGFVAIILVILIEDFIGLWLGDEFTLGKIAAVAISLNFYVTGTLLPLWSFRSATGLFRQTQWVILITAGLSILFSWLLGSHFGLVGIVLAPALARLLTGGWYEPWLLIRRHLTGNSWAYFRTQIFSFALWVSMASGILLIEGMLPLSGLSLLAAKASITLLIVPLGIWLAFRKTPAFLRLAARAGLSIGIQFQRKK